MTFHKALQNVKNWLVCASLGAYLSSSGCAMWRVSDSSAIPNVAMQNARNTSIDYAVLSWEDAIEQCRTPVQAQEYCRFLRNRPERVWDYGEHNYGFRRTHETGRYDCTEAAFAAAALLQDDGYGTIVMLLFDERTWAQHMVYVYREQNRFGSIGLNEIDYNLPVYACINDLALVLSQKWLSENRDFSRYDLINLVENDPDFITTDRDMIKYIFISNLQTIRNK